MEISVIGKNIQIDSVDSLAVENDNSTETVVFILDKFQNGLDLSVLNPFIIYSNSYGVRSEVMKKTIVDDKIYVEWVLTRAVTCANGRFDFCITFISSDNYTDISGNTKVWSTNIAHTKISGSLVGEEYIVPVEPIITQLLAVAAGITESGNIAKENSDNALKYANSAKDSADLAVDASQKAINEITKAEGIIETLINLIDEINGEVV